MSTNDRSEREQARGWFPSHPRSRELTALSIGIATGFGTFAATVTNGDPLSAALSSGSVGFAGGFLTVYILMLLGVTGRGG